MDTTDLEWDEGDGSVERFWLWMGQRGGGFKAGGKQHSKNAPFDQVSVRHDDCFSRAHLLRGSSCEHGGCWNSSAKTALPEPFLVSSKTVPAQFRGSSITVPV